MSKKIFLVIGPESSGNHLASLVLKTMGCYWEEPQKLDMVLKTTTSSPITHRQSKLKLKEVTDNPYLVLRRSVPHGHDMVNPPFIRGVFSSLGYEMYTILLQREWMATMLSNYYHRSNNVEEAQETLRKAERHIAYHVSHGFCDPFYVLNTSALMKDPKAVVRGLEYFTGLKWPSGVAYESIVKDTDIGRHSLLLDEGFKSIDRQKHQKYITKPVPLVKR